jgi:chromosome partitioning protein
MYDSRNKISAQVSREVRKHLGSKVFETRIPRNVKVSEAPSFGKPVIAYDYNCAGAQAYIRLVKEILSKNNLKQTA